MACTHTCHYSMLDFKAYKEDDSFIFGTDIQVIDIGVFVGDTVKTHVIEIFKFGKRISLNIVCGQKGEGFAREWLDEFQNVSHRLLHKLNHMTSRPP